MVGHKLNFWSAASCSLSLQQFANHEPKMFTNANKSKLLLISKSETKTMTLAWLTASHGRLCALADESKSEYKLVLKLGKQKKLFVYSF